MKKRKQDSWRTRLSTFGPSALILLIGFGIAYRFIEPPPPKRIVMSTGSESGAYYQVAQQYRQILADKGIDLVVLASAGTVENLGRLGDPESPVSLAMVQGGVADPEKFSELQSLASLFYEPLWIFTRSTEKISRIAQLTQHPFAIGPDGSGTQALMMLLLLETGIGMDQKNLLRLSDEEAIKAFFDGRINSIAIVATPQSEIVQRAILTEGVTLVGLDRADAFAMKYPFINRIFLPEGVMDLLRNLPPKEIQMLTTVATLVADKALHPALISQILQAAEAVHTRGSMIDPEGLFPSSAMVDFPLNPEAKNYYKHGPPFLQRYLPFWTASVIDRMIIMILPLVALLFPLIKVMPPIYRWRVRSRIYRWYAALDEVEEKIHQAEDSSAKRNQLQKLDQIEAEVMKVSTPLAYAEERYHLRLHIQFIRNSLRAGLDTEEQGP